MPEFLALNESDTQRFGQILSELLPNGTVVALIGTLGAGKTHLVQAIAQAEGVSPESVASPTFVLLHEYHGNRPIYHFDTYRLKDEDEFYELGPEEYFYGNGLTFVEWADRFPEVLPSDRLEITITIPEPQTRLFQWKAIGELYRDLAVQIKLHLN